MEQESLFPDATVEEEKDALLDSVASHLTPEKAEELHWVQEAILELAHEGKLFTADDVMARLDRLQFPNLVGIAFHQAARKELIEAVGFASAKRRSRHGAVVRVWRGKRRAR